MPAVGPVPSLSDALRASLAIERPVSGEAGTFSMKTCIKLPSCETVGPPTPVEERSVPGNVLKAEHQWHRTPLPLLLIKLQPNPVKVRVALPVSGVPQHDGTRLWHP